MANRIKLSILALYKSITQFLNQAYTGQCPAHAGFLKTVSVWTSVCVCVCVCMCVRPEVINN